MALGRLRPHAAARLILAFRKLFGQNRSLPVAGRLPHLEQVWLPYYLIQINTRVRESVTAVAVSVEAHSGAFAIFEMHDILTEGTPTGESFPPKLDASEAERLGRQALLAAFLRQVRTLKKSELLETLSVTLFLYPYWVYYYERRPELLDIRLLDAVTGQKAPSRTKAAILEAFCTVAQSRIERPRLEITAPD
jgi:hypothetical protein